MEMLLYILAKTVSIFLNVVYVAMLLRVLLQFFTDTESSPVFAICCYLSEPFIVPFRFILAKLNIGQNVPFDLGFISAAFGLSILTVLLPAI